MLCIIFSTCPVSSRELRPSLYHRHSTIGPPGTFDSNFDDGDDKLGRWTIDILTADFYKVVQVKFTPEIKAFYLQFERSISITLAIGYSDYHPLTNIGYSK